MRRILCGLLLAFSTVLLSGCQKKEVQPEEVLAEYIALLQEGNYEQMYEYLTAEAKTSVGQEAYVERYQNIYGGIEASDIRMTLLEQEEKKKSADTEVVPYTLSMQTIAGELSFDTSAILKRDEEGVYRLEWDSQDIFPGLSNTDRVRVVTVPANRGSIYDRNQVMLAGEGLASSVGLVPGKLPADRDQAIADLAELLDVGTDRIESALGAGWVRDDTFVPIRTVSRNDGELEKALLEIPGVLITDVPVRFYPFGKKAAQLTGYVQNITAEELKEREGQGYNGNSLLGKAGAERIYEETLRARDGYAIQILDEQGELKSVVLEKEAVDGQDVALTIDITLQQYLYQELEEDQGFAVAMNPVSGAVRALVSTPAYDPNDFVMGYTEGAWEEMNSDEAQPLYNRFLASWVPGSVLKPVVAAAGITAGTLDPQEDVKNEGLRWQKDSGWGDYYVTTLTDYSVKNLKNALIYSDNIYFAKATVKMGAEDFSRSLDRLGFGEELDFDFSLKASSYGGDGGIESETELADSGYGQGRVLVNPVHLAAVYSAFVNEGDMVRPYLKEGEGRAIWKEQVFSPETAEIVLDALYQVVEADGGTAHEAWREGYRMAGKTGTAELKVSKEDAQGKELGWFVGMCTEDVEEPLLTVMMIEDVRGRGGSSYAVKKAMKGFDAYIGGEEQ